MRFKEAWPARSALKKEHQQGAKMDLEIQVCSDAEHSPPEKLTDSMRKNQKPFEMKNLLAVENSSLNLVPF